MVYRSKLHQVPLEEGLSEVHLEALEVRRNEAQHHHHQLLKDRLHVQVASQLRHLEGELLKVYLHIQPASHSLLMVCPQVQMASQLRHLEEELPRACLPLPEVLQSCHLVEEFHRAHLPIGVFCQRRNAGAVILTRVHCEATLRALLKDARTCIAERR